MAWIESHQSLRDHRKTDRLMSILGLSRREVVGTMQGLWWWGLDNSKDGDVSKIDFGGMARAAFWDGEPDQFVDALVAAGFADRTTEGIHIHSWDKYAGRLILKREANAQRMRDARAEGKVTINEEREEHVQRTCNARAGATNRTNQQTVPTNKPKDALAKANGADAPPVDASPEDDAGIHERCLVELKAATTQQGRVGVLMQGYTALFGKKYKANAGRLAGLAGPKGMNSASELLALMFRSAASWDGVDDPHDYLTAAVTEHVNRRNDKRNGHTNGHGPPLDPIAMNAAVDDAQKRSIERFREYKN